MSVCAFSLFRVMHLGHVISYTWCEKNTTKQKNDNHHIHDKPILLDIVANHLKYAPRNSRIVFFF